MAGTATDLAALDRQIAEQRRPALPTAPLLMTAPGIGAVPATAVARCLTSKAFGHPD